MNVYEKILAERSRQIKKWGKQNHNDYYWMGILGEEFGEICRNIIDTAYRALPPIPLKGSFSSHLNIQSSRLIPEIKNELIQTAAVCIAWLEALERRK